MNKYFKTTLFLLLGGVIALGAGLFFTITSRNQMSRDTEPATATVVEYVEGQEYSSSSETYNTVFYPVVSYEADGKTVQAQYSQYEYSQVYPIGETIDIKYNPDNPEEFYITSDSNRLSFGTIWEIPLGVILLLVGLGRIVVPVIMSKKQK